MTPDEVARRLWPLVAQHLPNTGGSATRGRPRIADEIVFEKLVLFMRAGCSWATFDQLCRGSGVSGRTCRLRFAEWCALGLFELVMNTLRSELPTAQIAHLDATFVRSRGGGEELVGLTRHGKGSKIQAMVNEDSMPLMFQLTSANPNESTITRTLLEDVDELPPVVVADKAYDYDFLRDAFQERGSKCYPRTELTARNHLETKSKSVVTTSADGSSNASSHGSPPGGGSPTDGNATPTATGNGSASESASSTPAANIGHNF
jgi:transposase